jgi:hypothetical protein
VVEAELHITERDRTGLVVTVAWIMYKITNVAEDG